MKAPASIPMSWIQSFYDAPNGFQEEMQEIMISAGLGILVPETICHTCRIFP